MKVRSVLMLSCSVLFFLSDSANGMISQSSNSYESDKYNPHNYKITNQNYKNEIATMGLQNVEDYLSLVEYEIDECIRDLENVLAVLQNLNQGDNAKLSQPVSQIIDSLNLIRNDREIIFLLQQRNEELKSNEKLEHSMFLKDKMISLTECDRHNISSQPVNVQMDKSINDIQKKIEKEAERITGYGMFLWDEAEQRFTVSE